MLMCEQAIVLFVAFFAIFRSSDSQTVCKGSDNDACGCDLINGDGVIDLRFGNQDPTQPLFSGIPSSSTGDTTTYSYNPCYPFASPDNTINGLAVLSFENNVYLGIGQQSTATFITVGDGLIGVVYNSSDGFSSSTVQLSCSQSGANKVTAGENDDYLNYKFTLTGPGACPMSSSSGGLSGGSIFLILFFVTIVIYIIGGMVYQKKINNATGSDVIPNKGFWVSLPGLIKDGAVFLFYKCRCKSPPDGSYESI